MTGGRGSKIKKPNCIGICGVEIKIKKKETAQKGMEYFLFLKQKDKPFDNNFTCQKESSRKQ